MQSASASSSPSPSPRSITPGLAIIFDNKNAFIREMESNPLLGLSFRASFNAKQNCYEIAASDMPWVCHCKSLINALNLLETHPKIAKGLTKFAHNDKSFVSLGATMANNLETLNKLEYYIDACQYYGAQETGEFLEIVPHLQNLSTHFMDLVKGFSFVEKILNPASEGFMNPEETNLGQYLQTSLLKDELGKIHDIKSMKSFADNLVSKFKQDFDKLKSELGKVANDQGLVGAVVDEEARKQKIQSELITWYHTAESLRVNYGIDTKLIEEQLAVKSKELFGDDYQLWQYASNEVSLEQKLHERVRLERVKEMIVNQELTNKTDLSTLFSVREELKDIMSFDMRVYINQIDASIDKRTNMHALNKVINHLESEITLLSCKEDAKLDKSPSSTPAAEINPIILKHQQQLETFYSIREELQEKIDAIKAHKTTDVFHYNKKKPDNKKKPGIDPGESDHRSSDPIVPQKSDQYKKAVAAINLALTTNEKQTAFIRVNKLYLSSNLAALHAQEPKEIVEENLQTIKQMIMDTQREKSRNAFKLSDVQEKTTELANSLSPKPASHAERLSIVSVRPFTNVIKQQVSELKKHLNAETRATLFEDGSDQISKKINDTDKPIVKLIKASLQALKLFEKNSRNIQELQAIYKVSKASVAKKVMTGNFTKNLHALPEIIGNLQTYLNDVHQTIAKSPARNMLQLPIISQIEKIMTPLEALYQQL